MGLDNPAATIFWLSPAMGLTLAIISMVLDNWIKVFRSSFFDGVWTSLITALYLLAPGVIAFCMLMSEFYIVQRAGVVPMSIAGIAKEVTTITISAWFFGDELTPLNITGVAVTICGITLFTYHKYRKSIESTVPLDDHGYPVTLEDVDGHDDGGAYVELDQTDRTHASTVRTESEADTESTYTNRQLLFSAEGEEDAEEYRSIRSSKVQWDSQSHGPEVIEGRDDFVDQAVPGERIEETPMLPAR